MLGFFKSHPVYFCNSIAINWRLSCFFFLIVFANGTYAQTDSIEHQLKQTVSLGFSSRGQINTQTPNVSYSLHKLKANYAYFLTPNFQFNAGFVGSKAWSDYDAFDKNYMINFEIGSRFYWKKLHVQVGLHGGNYAEFIQDTEFRPPFIQYASMGGGVTFPIFNKLTLELEFRKLYVLRILSGYTGKSPFESFFTVNYCIDGTNAQFRAKNKIKLPDILSPKANFIGYTFFGGAFKWESNEGPPFTYMQHAINYRRILTKHWNVTAGIFNTFIVTNQDTVNGINKKNYNTFNLTLDGRFQLGPFFAGLGLTSGTFAAYDDLEYADRNLKFYLTPQLGYNLRIKNTWIFDFQIKYGLSINQWINSSHPSTHYPIGSIGVYKKIGQKAK